MISVPSSCFQSSQEKIEVFDVETVSPEATVTSNDELAQDILLSDRKVFAYVYSRVVKLYYLRSEEALPSLCNTS